MDWAKKWSHLVGDRGRPRSAWFEQAEQQQTNIVLAWQFDVQQLGVAESCKPEESYLEHVLHQNNGQIKIKSIFKW